MLARNRFGLMASFVALILLGAFQNCSKTNFSSQDLSQAASVEGGSSSSSSSAPSPTPTTPSGTEPGDDSYCSTQLQSLPGGAQQAPSIAYDSLPASTVAAESVTEFVSLQPINYPNVQLVGDGVATTVAVTAARIAQVDNLLAKQVLLNAQSVGSLSSFGADLVTVVTHSLGDTDAFLSGRLCVSAQTISSVHDFASLGVSSFFGRGENSQVATIENVGATAGFLNFHNFNIRQISAAFIMVRLTGSHLQTLTEGAGVIYLQNSVIDSVSKFAGTIHLRGASSVTSISPDSAVVVIQDP